ncbi:MAG: PTS fructose transporter subunit IIA [Pseudomonadota bacterium]|nr:PTS fructose transporter subunit IIA [Pseudomonadota bacterium]
MIGILIVAHGNLGESFIQCASHVLGYWPEKLEALGVSDSDDPKDILERAKQCVKRLDSGDGVLIFSDMYGATPSNIICALLEPGRIEGVTGISLPMLMRALTYRNDPLLDVVSKAVSSGSEGVVQITQDICYVASKR